MSPRIKAEIDMTMVRSFIRYIGIISFVMLTITLVGFFMATKSETNIVIYTLVLIINLIVTLGAYVSLKLLKDK